MIGEAAAMLREGIPDAREVILKRTGHMFRFSHPHTYANTIAAFDEEPTQRPRGAPVNDALQLLRGSPAVRAVE